MEKCHEKWLEYIDEKREEYHYLNYFTIDQMVTLQKELVKLSDESEPSKLIYPLLSAIKDGCTKADLVAAMRQAKNDVATKSQEKDEQATEEEVEELPRDTGADVAKFIEEMVTAGYSEKVAKAALEFVKPDEIDEGNYFLTYQIGESLDLPVHGKPYLSPRCMDD